MSTKKLWAIHNSSNGHWLYIMASSFDNAIKAAREVEKGFNGGRVVDNDRFTADIITD